MPLVLSFFIVYSNSYYLLKSSASLPSVNILWTTFSIMGSYFNASWAKSSFCKWTDSQKAMRTSYLNILESKRFLISENPVSKSSSSSLKICCSLGFWIEKGTSLYHLYLNILLRSQDSWFSHCAVGQTVGSRLILFSFLARWIYLAEDFVYTLMWRYLHIIIH